MGTTLYGFVNGFFLIPLKRMYLVVIGDKLFSALSILLKHICFIYLIK